MSQKMRQFTDIVLQDPAVDTVVPSPVAAMAPYGAHVRAAQAANERKISIDQVIARIRGKTAKIPGAALYLQAGQDLNVGGRFGGRNISTRFKRTISVTSPTGRPSSCSGCKKFLKLRDVNSEANAWAAKFGW